MSGIHETPLCKLCNTYHLPPCDQEGRSESASPTGSAICECRDWCGLDLRQRLLTGHHATCKHSHPMKAAYELIADLARGMEHWAHDEDGIHPNAWEAYRKAKALEGVILPNDQIQP